VPPTMPMLMVLAVICRIDAHFVLPSQPAPETGHSPADPRVQKRQSRPQAASFR